MKFKYTKNKRYNFRFPSRHYSNLLDRVREYVKNSDKHSLTKENLAILFKAKIHEIEHCFHKLNLEGLLGQASHSRGHDGYWSPDTYHIQHNDYMDFEEQKVGKIYLVNLERARMLKDDVVKLFVARQHTTDIEKFNYKWVRKLAPSEKLKDNFKSNQITWKEYVPLYNKEVINNPDCKQALDTIFNHLIAGEDIALICYCQNSNLCHRGLLAEHFRHKGIEIVDVGVENTTTDMCDLLSYGCLTTQWENRFFRILLDNDKVDFLLDRNRKNYKYVLTKEQVRIAAEKVCRFRDTKLAKVLNAHSYEIPKDLRGEFDSILVLGSLTSF